MANEVVTRGQAAIETTLAMLAAMLLLFGILKVALWMSERVVQREVVYERSRARAASIPQQPGGTDWSSVNWDTAGWRERDQKLQVFR